MNTKPWVVAAVGCLLLILLSRWMYFQYRHDKVMECKHTAQALHLPEWRHEHLTGCQVKVKGQWLHPYWKEYYKVEFAPLGATD